MRSDFSLKKKKEQQVTHKAHIIWQKKKIGHSIERVWHSASREPSDNLPGSQPCTQAHSIYNYYSVLSGFPVSL